MLKYGKLALVDGLSGSSGQVALPHGDAAEPVPAPLARISVASPLAATRIGTGRGRQVVTTSAATPEPEGDGR
jgi:hypothetical protein